MLRRKTISDSHFAMEMPLTTTQPKAPNKKDYWQALYDKVTTFTHKNVNKHGTTKGVGTTATSNTQAMRHDKFHNINTARDFGFEARGVG